MISLTNFSDRCNYMQLTHSKISNRPLQTTSAPRWHPVLSFWYSLAARHFSPFVVTAAIKGPGKAKRQKGLAAVAGEMVRRYLSASTIHVH